MDGYVWLTLISGLAFGGVLFYLANIGEGDDEDGTDI